MARQVYIVSYGEAGPPEVGEGVFLDEYDSWGGGGRFLGTMVRSSLRWRGEGGIDDYDVVVEDGVG